MTGRMTNKTKKPTVLPLHTPAKITLLNAEQLTQIHGGDGATGLRRPL